MEIKNKEDHQKNFFNINTSSSRLFLYSLVLAM